MAQLQLWGTDASISMPSGSGLRANAFTIDYAQGVTEAFGYGDTYLERHGTIQSASGTVSGFTTYGTSADDPGIPTSGSASALFTRAGSSLTMTWKSGNTVTVTAIFTALSMANAFLGTPTSTYAWVSTGKPVESWTVA